jgi:hypothetical protein
MPNTKIRNTVFVTLSVLNFMRPAHGTAVPCRLKQSEGGF